MAFAKTIPYAIGNPMYHWIHLELQRYFDINTPLSEKTGEEIYHLCNKKFESGTLTVRQLLKKSNVKKLCTTDDTIDELKYHKLLKEEGFDIQVLPTIRPWFGCCDVFGSKQRASRCYFPKRLARRNPK